MRTRGGEGGGGGRREEDEEWEEVGGERDGNGGMAALFPSLPPSTPRR
jgi:hypothetical protein